MEEPGLFKRSKLKSYANKLNSSIDASMALVSSVALAPGVLFAPVAALADQVTATLTEPGSPCVILLPPAPGTTSTEQQHHLPAAGLDHLVSDIQTLKSEIAGVQCALAYMKGADDISTLGKKLGRRVTQEQLRKRAEMVTRSLNELPFKQYTAGHQHDSSTTAHAAGNASVKDSTSIISPQGRDASCGSLPPASPVCAAGAAEPASRSACSSPLTRRMSGAHHQPATQRPQSSLCQPACRPQQGAVSEGGARLAPLHPAACERARRAGSAASSMRGDAASVCASVDAPSNMSQRGFDGLGTDVDVQAPQAWARGRPIVPVGRGEAVILEAALDEALPAGTLTAKYAQPAQELAACVAHGSPAAGLPELLQVSHGRLQHPRDEPPLRGSAPSSPRLSPSSPARAVPGSPARVLLASQDMRADWQLLDSVLSEAARQVAAGCAERGRLLLKIGERYGEAFECLYAFVTALHAVNAALHASLSAEQATTAQQAQLLLEKEAELKTKQQAVDERDFRIASLSAELEHCQWDRQQQVAQLTEQNQILASQLEDANAALEETRESAAAALAECKESLEAQLCAVTDERDDLLGRLRFVERQVAALRHGTAKGAAMLSSMNQTDPVQWVGEEDVEAEDPGLDTLSNGMSGMSVLVVGSRAPKRRRRPNQALGGFEGLITSSRQGRIRGLQWTQAAIQQLYVDKVVADTVADRDGRPRQRVCEFAMDWHLTKYGLVPLAEANVLDLIASTRHHAKTVPRVRWFAQFIGLQELGRDVVDTTQHLSFYLFLLQQLAFPAALTCLFPDHADSSPPLISANALPEVAKAVFRYLNDPELGPVFITQVVEPMVECEPNQHDVQAVPLDSLIRVFMAEYHQRYARATSHLTSLFQAGDADTDGLIKYDTFVALIDLAATDAPERLKAAMYSEALRTLPAGQHAIPCATWLHVARTFGFDRWKVDPTAFVAKLRNAPTPGQLLSQGPGVLPLLAGLRGSSASGAREQGSPSRVQHRPDSSSSSSILALHRADSTRQVNRSIWGALLSSLRDMEPALPALLQSAMQALPSGSSRLAGLLLQATHFSCSLAGLPTAKGSPAIEAMLSGFAELGCGSTDASAAPGQPSDGGLGGGRRGSTGLRRSRSNRALSEARSAAAACNAQASVPATARRASGAQGPRGSVGAYGLPDGLAARSQASLSCSGGQGAALGGKGSAAQSYWDVAKQGAGAQPHSPSDAPQAWLAFQLVYTAIEDALSAPGARSEGGPAASARSRPGSCSPASSRPGSPARSRRIIMPAMPWRNGRMSPVLGPPAAPLPARPASSAPSSVPAGGAPGAGKGRGGTGGGGLSVTAPEQPAQPPAQADSSPQAAVHAAIDGAQSLTAAMQAYHDAVISQAPQDTAGSSADHQHGGEDLMTEPSHAFVGAAKLLEAAEGMQGDDAGVWAVPSQEFCGFPQMSG